MRTITWLPNWDAAVSKTIKKVIPEEYAGDVTELVFLFEDDTALYLDIDHGYDGDTGFEVDSKPTLQDSTMLALGLTTEQELTTKKQRVKDAENRRNAEMERAEYERLKAKFGDRREP
jgi:hypothetical protein